MIIKSDRLILRNLSETDLDFIYVLESNPLVYLYDENEEPSKEHIYEKYCKRITSMIQNKDKYFVFLIALLPEEIPVGEIHIQLNWEEICEWEIGYKLHPDYWGNGYASEAAKLMLKFLFESLNAHKVVGFCNANNKKSANLMERIGMKRDGILREGKLLRKEWCDEFVYSILNRDYYR